MEYVDLHNIVIQKLKSESLKNAIEKENVVFAPIELFKIIYEYIERYDDKISLLKQMLLVIDDEEIIAYTRYIIGWLEGNFYEFKSNSTDCIFEIHIKESPETGVESYICNSFCSAINLIAEYYKKYDFRPNVRAKYEIVKRKIYDSDISVIEDFIGSCTLDYQKNICDVCFREDPDYYKCDGVCFECDRICITNIDINFPVFTGFKDLVKYQDYNRGIKYGICWDEPEFQGEECYIIPLDSFALRYHNFDKAHDFHKHIPYPYVEKADESDLTNEDKNIYREYLLYLDIIDSN